MPTSMEKPLDGAGLAVVNQIFNERLSQLGSGSGGVNWDAAPYTGMTYANNNDIFFWPVVSIERMNQMIRLVRGVVVVHVKKETYSGSQTMDINLPEGFPSLTFNAVSNTIPMMTGTGSVKAQMTGAGSKVTFALNQDKTALAGGLYIGCVLATVVG